MKYEKSDRVQHESYCCLLCFLSDVLETLFDESNDEGQVHIIADEFITGELIKLICKVEIDDFEFDLQVVEFDKDNAEEYRITILDSGEVYIESAVDKNGEYHDCDGFIFADVDVDESVIQGNNRRCDVMIFDIDEI